MDIVWQLKKYKELTIDELYAILRLRTEVFVLEQNCVFQDIDDKDQPSYHFMGWQHDLLCAYTRIVPPGAAFKNPSIGRVVTSPKKRSGGLGRILMERSIDETLKIFGDTDIEVGAQFYLKKFYTSLGFVQHSDIYLEDGIEHIKMIRFYRSS